MSGILSQIGAELLLGLVGTVVGSIWTAFKSLDFMRSRRAERYDEAVRALNPVSRKRTKSMSGTSKKRGPTGNSRRGNGGQLATGRSSMQSTVHATGVSISSNLSAGTISRF